MEQWKYSFKSRRRMQITGQEKQLKIKTGSSDGLIVIYN
jgi:hypothetical protein